MIKQKKKTPKKHHSWKKHMRGAHNDLLLLSFLNLKNKTEGKIHILQDHASNASDQ